MSTIPRLDRSATYTGGVGGSLSEGGSFSSGGPGGDTGGFLHGLGNILRDTIYGIGPAIATLGEAAGSDLIHHSAASSIVEALKGNPKEALNDLNPLTGQIGKKVIIPQAQSEQAYWTHPIRNIEHGNVVTPLLDVLAILSLGGGRAAAVALTPAGEGRGVAALTGRYGGPERSIVARVSDEPGKLQVTRVLPRSGYRATKAMALDSANRAIFGTKGIELPGGRLVGQSRGEFRRAAKAAERGAARTEFLAAASDPRVVAFQKAFSKLNVPQRIAFNVIGRVPLPEDLEAWRGILESSDQPSARQALDLLDNPRVMDEYEVQSPKLTSALNAWKGITDARQEILLRHGAIDPVGIEEGSLRHTRIVRGAEILTKSEAWKQTRRLNAQIRTLIGEQGSLVGKARKVGKQDIQTQIKEGVHASQKAIKSAKARQRYLALTADTEAKLYHARSLREDLRRLAAGEEGSTERVEIPGSEPSTIEGMGAAFVKAEITANLKRAQASLKRLDKATADPKWKERIDQEIKELQGQFDAKDPKRQKVWRQRLGDQLAQLKARRKSLQGQALARANYEAQILKHQKDLRDLEGGTLVSTPLADPRLEAMGRLHDEVAAAYDDYERALVAEQAYQREVARGSSAASAQRAAKVGEKQAREDRIAALQGMRAKYHELLDARHELIVQKEDIRSRIGRLVGGGEPDELRQEIEAADRPVPGYLHDQPARVGRAIRSQTTGSIGPPRPGADVFTSRGTLFRHGQIDLVGDTITPAFFRAAKHQLQIRLHDWAMENGVRVPYGANLPDGYEWVRKYRGQRIPEIQTTAAEHVRATSPFDGLNPDEHDQITFKRNEEAPEEQIDTVEENGQRYRVAVPTQVADHFRAQFDGGTTLGSRFVRSFTNIWRALLLKTRINWLENNIIGNTVMASIRFAGVQGLKAYLNLVLNTAGPRKVAELLGADVTKRVLSPEQIAHIAPEALRATHVETQIPTFGGLTVRGTGRAAGAANKTLRAGSKAINLLPAADRWYEQFLRKGAIETTFRQQPEVRAIYKAMPSGERNWQDAMVQAVEQHPHLQPLAVREMNDALGDFLSLSKAEREQVRQLIPFYAWLREITRVSAKIVVDTPGRAKLLQLLGQVGAQSSPKDVPSYLRGGIEVSGLPSWLGGTSVPGQQQVVATRSMNPFTTPIDVGAAIGNLLSTGGDTRNLTSQLSPLLASLFSLDRNEPIAGVKAPLILQPAVQTIQGLPQYRAAFGAPSSLYPTRGTLDTILQSMGGSPFRTYDINQARIRAAQGQ